MQTYIILLRGINVGGHKKIKMADLKSLLEKAGYLTVRTYIQSGNIVLQWSGVDETQLAADISALIKKEYEFEVPVMAIPSKEWAEIISNQPFDNEDISKLYLTLLSDSPTKETIDSINPDDFLPLEFFKIIGRSVYLHCPNGYGKSKLTNDFWERKLKLSATTRNWRTSLTLLEMGQP